MTDAKGLSVTGINIIQEENAKLRHENRALAKKLAACEEQLNIREIVTPIRERYIHLGVDADWAEVAGRLKADLARVTQERDDFQAKYHEAMDILTRWENIDSAADVAEYAAAIKLLNKFGVPNVKQPGPNAELLSLSDRVGIILVERDRLKAALTKATHELNAIRARDGAPQHIDWYQGKPMQTNGCDPEYFSQLVDECQAALGEATP